MVEVSFSDTGQGIVKDNIPKLFDPFYTTKQTGKGTGLGLAISYGIIQSHNGDIKVESEHGKGIDVPDHPSRQLRITEAGRRKLEVQKRKPQHCKPN